MSAVNRITAGERYVGDQPPEISELFLLRH
jgi:hypothetical protein